MFIFRRILNLMKTLTKILSAVLVCCMLFSLCACHGKDETALTIEGEKITSALYLKALIDCDSEARSIVEKQITEAEKDKEQKTDMSKLDYYAQSIDGVKFTDYVKNKAIDRCKEYIFYKKLMEDGTLKFEKDEKAGTDELENVNFYAEYYWANNLDSFLYEPNGVYYETYEKAYLYSYCSQKYFDFLYKEGGEKEVPQKEIKSYLLENYALAYALTAEYKENSTDDDKAELKKKLEGYAKRIKDGEEFEKIYLEHTGSKAEDHKHEENADGPKLQHTSLLANSEIESQYSNPDFDDVYDLKIGETVIVENEAKTGLTLYVKVDIGDDKYYLTNLTDEILVLTKEDEFQKSVDEKIKDYKVEKNDYAIDRFELEDISYTELQNAYAAYSAQQQY